MKRLTCLLPIICSVADAVIAPTAIHRKASDGILEVWVSILFAICPSERHATSARAKSVAIDAPCHLIDSRIRKAGARVVDRLIAAGRKPAFGTLRRPRRPGAQPTVRACVQDA